MLRSGGKKWRGLAGLGRAEIPFQNEKRGGHPQNSCV